MMPESNFFAFLTLAYQVGNKLNTCLYGARTRSDQSKYTVACLLTRAKPTPGATRGGWPGPEVPNMGAISVFLPFSGTCLFLSHQRSQQGRDGTHVHGLIHRQKFQVSTRSDKVLWTYLLDTTHSVTP